jgi:hypothetical protein
MNKYVAYGIGCLLFALAVYFSFKWYGDFRVSENNREWEHRIATAPVVSDTARDTVWVTPPGLSGSAAARPAFVSPEERGRIDSMKRDAENCWELVDRVLAPVAMDTSDTESVERLYVEYHPVQDRFYYDLRLRPQPNIQSTITNTKTVLVRERSTWWLDVHPAFQRGPLTGISIGYDRVGVGVLASPGTMPLWMATIRLLGGTRRE